MRCEDVNIHGGHCPNPCQVKVTERGRLDDTFSSTRAKSRERRLKLYVLPFFSAVYRWKGFNFLDTCIMEEKARKIMASLFLEFSLVEDWAMPAVITAVKAHLHDELQLSLPSASRTR